MRPYYQDDHVTIATGVRRDYPDAVEQCPMQLMDNHDDWYLHFLIEHGTNGYSVRMYQAQTIEEELATITQDRRP